MCALSWVRMTKPLRLNVQNSGVTAGRRAYRYIDESAVRDFGRSDRSAGGGRVRCLHGIRGAIG